MLQTRQLQRINWMVDHSFCVLPATVVATHDQRSDPTVGVGKRSFQVHRWCPLQPVPLAERL